eukprot:1769263-Amphidinium_carterae.1
MDCFQVGKKQNEQIKITADEQNQSFGCFVLAVLGRHAGVSELLPSPICALVECVGDHVQLFEKRTYKRIQLDVIV